MRSRWTLIVLLIGLFPLTALAQDATTRPAGESARATTRPQTTSRFENYRNNRRNDRRSSQPAPAALPAIYDAVASRNIFIKGDQRPPPVVNNPASADTGFQGPTPSQLFLTGVSLEDNKKVAFLEDKQSYTSTQVKVGDQIANGKIVSITIDTLDYKDRDGNIVHVRVGLNLAGGDTSGVGYTPTAGSSTQPAEGGPRLPGESIVDYLHRRRAAELNH